MSLLLWGALIYLYSHVPLSEFVEMRLYDIRTQVLNFASFTAANHDLPLVVKLGPTEFDPVKKHGNGGFVFSGSKVATIAEEIARSGARELVILIDNFAYLLEEASLQPLVDLTLKNPNITIGLLGFSSDVPSSYEMPDFLLPIKDRIRGYESIKKRSNSIVRSLAIDAYLGQEKRELLPGYLREKLQPNLEKLVTANYFGEPKPGVLIRWFKDSLIDQWTVAMARDKRLKRPGIFDNRIVILGYSFLPNYSEGFVYNPLENTPLKGDPNIFTSGEPLTNVTATTIYNFVSDIYLKPASNVFIISQWIFVLIGFLIATFSSLNLSVLFGLITVITVSLAPTMLMSGFFRIYLPSGDALVVCGFFFSVVAIWRASRDISTVAQKQVEASYQAKMSQTQSKFLSLFSDEMSSRIKNLHSDFLDFDKLVTDQQVNALVMEKLHQSLNGFTDMVGTIRQFALVADDKGQSFPPRFFLVRLRLEQIASTFTNSLQEKSILIVNEVDEKIQVFANEQVFDLIVHNFISNAIKYSPKDSLVKLQAQILLDKKISIDVVDQGCGIEKDQLENIFEKFFRIQNPNTIDSRGLGLGLFLVKFFAAKAKMTIQCKSDSGKGSCFSLVMRGQR